MGLKRPGTVTGASGTAYWARRPLGRLLREDLACRPPAALQHPAALWKGGALRVTCSHQCILMCVAIYYTRKCADCQSIYFATRCIHKMKRIHHAPPALAAAGRLRYIYIVRQTTRNEGYPMKIEEISARLAGLAVFRGLLEDPVLAAYSALIRALAEGAGRLAVCEAAGT